MNCDQMEELLSDLIDDELAEGARAGVEAHVEGCERCGATYKQMLRTVRFVRANARVDIVPGTTGALYAEFTRSHSDPAVRGSTNELIRREGFDGEKGDSG